MELLRSLLDEVEVSEQEMDEVGDNPNEIMDINHDRERIRKKLNQAQLHKELQHRKMRPNETVFQYLVAIRELANRGQGFLDETSIMEYCINGIPDSPSNKLILYGCTTIQEFKEKLGIYDKIFQNKSKNHSYDTSRSPNF
ncbi:uncharacterized protein TNCV_343921 [Trichonephila clavipes]|nr:uncharacterized protein TNCV_343921 [Trichonephila clavipes]